jgi:outer membrane protein OmpA-like peptidoglycan-associated protein
MKKLIALIVLLLFLLLTWFSWGWYKDTVVCCDEAAVTEQMGPLVFKCGSDVPVTNDLWPAKKGEIVAGKAVGKKLLILGPYFEGEEESLGYSRAEKIKNLLVDELGEEVFELEATPAGDCEKAKLKPLHGTRIKWVIRNENVIEHFDKTFIYFKYNTTDPIDTREVVEYLDNLANYLISSGESVLVTGHTDADGSDEFNVELGLKRANRAKNYLISKGVPEERIKVESKGKSEPLSTNQTPEGRQKNRRVELKIISN